MANRCYNAAFYGALVVVFMMIEGGVWPYCICLLSCAGVAFQGWRLLRLR
jgi:hypothetical protein